MAVIWKRLAYENDVILHALATAVNDFLVASGAGVFVKKTLAETRTILFDELNNSGARAHRAVNQAIPAAGITKILLDTENYDTGSNFDLPNSQYVVPATGKYLVIGSAYWEGQAVSSIYVNTYVYVDAALATRAAAWQQVNVANIVGMTMDILSLTAAQVVDLRVWTDNAQNVLGSSPSTFLSIRRLA